MALVSLYLLENAANNPSYPTVTRYLIFLAYVAFLFDATPLCFQFMLNSLIFFVQWLVFRPERAEDIKYPEPDNADYPVLIILYYMRLLKFYHYAVALTYFTVKGCLLVLEMVQMIITEMVITRRCPDMSKFLAIIVLVHGQVFFIKLINSDS